MRKIRIPLILGALLCCLFALAACGGTRLSTPIGLNVNPDTLVISWYEVDEADRYIVDVNGVETTVRDSEYDLARLEPGEYRIRVRALDLDGLYAESSWSETTDFTRATESGLSYRLIDSNSAYEVVGIGTASGDVVVESEYRGKPVTSIAEGHSTAPAV